MPRRKCGVKIQKTAKPTVKNNRQPTNTVRKKSKTPIIFFHLEINNVYLHADKNT